jgi:hypothetical protein
MRPPTSASSGIWLSTSLVPIPTTPTFLRGKLKRAGSNDAFLFDLLDHMR